MTLFSKILAGLFALPLLFSAPAARADDAAIGIFLASVAVAQAEAMRAQANYYEAIGYAQKAQDTLKIAEGYKNGSFGGNEGVNTFVATSAALTNDIYQLEAIGAPLDAAQRQKAKKAKQQLVVAKVAFIAALASGTVMVLKSDGNFLQKLALGAVVGVTVAKLSKSMKEVSRAAKAFGTISLGRTGGFQIVSKELAPGFADL
jgi:hypothetical protein